MHYPGLAVQNSVAPRLVRGRDGGPDVASFSVALRYLIILQAAIIAPVIAWAGPIINLLLGPSYAPAAPVLRILAPYIFLHGLGPLVAVGLNYLGESRRRVPIALASLVVLIVVGTLTIPQLGARGGAIADSASFLLYGPAHLWICSRVLSVSLRPFLVTAARSLLAAAAAAGVLALVGTEHLSLFDWVLGGAGATAAFLGVLFISGELPAAAYAQAYAAVSRRFRPKLPAA